jgi:hypothetical protein
MSTGRLDDGIEVRSRLASQQQGRRRQLGSGGTGWSCSASFPTKERNSAQCHCIDNCSFTGCQHATDATYVSDMLYMSMTLVVALLISAACLPALWYGCFARAIVGLHHAVTLALQYDGTKQGQGLAALRRLNRLGLTLTNFNSISPANPSEQAPPRNR